MSFTTLPPSLTLALLAGERDEISEAQQERINKIKATPCPRCGASLHPKLRQAAVFGPDDPLPKMLASCECGYLADCSTGLVLALGSEAKMQDDPMLIKP
jgi:RNase P subunit RPR2